MVLILVFVLLYTKRPPDRDCFYHRGAFASLSHSVAVFSTHSHDALRYRAICFARFLSISSWRIVGGGRFTQPGVETLKPREALLAQPKAQIRRFFSEQDPLLDNLEHLNYICSDTSVTFVLANSPGYGL